MITYNVSGNSVAGETIRRLKDVANREFNVDLRLGSDREEQFPTLNYGISDFSLSKRQQAELFEVVLPNTILSDENKSVISDYDLVILKNPTRLLLWKDAKHEDTDCVYLYVKNKDEWRINYAYGKILGILNKNIENGIFGKSHLSKWTLEKDESIIKILSNYTLEIAEMVESCSNLKSFGLDIIRNKDTGEFLFLELNQANSMNEDMCIRFMDCFMDYETKRLCPQSKPTTKNVDYELVDRLLELFTGEELEYIKKKLGGN